MLFHRDSYQDVYAHLLTARYIQETLKSRIRKPGPSLRTEA
jgi:hypothetical protein